MERVPMDLEAYEDRVRSGPCFICATVANEAGYDHEIVYEDEDHIAFLGKYPTLYGHTLVCPKRHREHAVADFAGDEYLRLQAVVHTVGRALQTVVPTERLYVLSLGSRAGNAHVHWHLAPLPPGVPYPEQQHHALMTENGIIPWSRAQAAALAAKLREALLIQAQ